jgi:trans-aconitate methyltransferase
MVENEWDAATYDERHDYVAAYGASLVDLLDPSPDERVLDLGCGTGRLTAEIADTAAAVVGLDRAAEMVERARERETAAQFRRADAREFTVDRPFDAVFSNAVLHWIADEDDHRRVLERVHDALTPGGRFVAEMGGAGNVATIASAVREVLAERGHEVETPWRFPTVGEEAALLEAAGFEVRLARLFDRPTPLAGEDGLREWLAMFGDSVFEELDEATRTGVVDEVETRLRPSLYDPDVEEWTADYRRLRFVAVRNGN